MTLCKSKSDQSIFLFAHQDDEAGVFFTIQKELKRGSDVYCMYLSSGTRTFDNKLIKKRNNESLAVLKALGVNPNNIHFSESLGNFLDQTLIKNINEITKKVEKFIRNKNCCTLYVPAWEGGHPDHDALNVVAAFLCYKHPLIKSFQFSLYNANKRSKYFFNVISPIDKNGPVITDQIPSENIMLYLKLCCYYPSQIKTWIALYPFFLLHFIFLRKQFLQKIIFSRIFERPHKGLLYYEARNFISYNEVSNFIKRSYFDILKK